VGKGTTVVDALTGLLRDAAGKEHPDLEFKRDLTLINAAQKSEFAKDVASQANLPSGGNIVYGAGDDGELVGLTEEPDIDQAASVLANRLQFAPPGIDCRRVDIPGAVAPRLPLALWVRVPANPYTVGTCFLSVDGTWKMPIRVDSVTKYLSPAEALSQHLQKVRGVPPQPVGKHASATYDSDPDDVVENLDSNLLPVLELPPSAWVARTNCRSEGEVREACGSDLPPFRVVRGKLYSLRPGVEAHPAYSAAITSSGGSKPLQELLRNRDDRRMVIGLLNAEIGRYALRKGLVPEVEGHRVYFPPEDGRPRSISWHSFTKKATREVVGTRKRSDGSVDHWFHFAVGLQIQDLRNRFALLLNPSWVFTYDGQQQLRSYEVAPVATPKMNREDNARILYNTQFWAQFLAGDGGRIESPLCDGPLIISTDTVKIKVPFGIAADRISTSPTTLSDADLPPEILWRDIAEVDDEVQQEIEKWT
jgi:hypothetical protein